ncbi:hypothetical protein ACO2Q1_04690 [Brevundimonas sp. VNH65]
MSRKIALTAADLEQLDHLRVRDMNRATEPTTALLAGSAKPWLSGCLRGA